MNDYYNCTDNSNNNDSSRSYKPYISHQSFSKQLKSNKKNKNTINIKCQSLTIEKNKNSNETIHSNAKTTAHSYLNTSISNSSVKEKSKIKVKTTLNYLLSKSSSSSKYQKTKKKLDYPEIKDSNLNNVITPDIQNRIMNFDEKINEIEEIESNNINNDHENQHINNQINSNLCFSERLKSNFLELKQMKTDYECQVQAKTNELKHIENNIISYKQKLSQIKTTEFDSLVVNRQLIKYNEKLKINDMILLYKDKDPYFEEKERIKKDILLMREEIHENDLNSKKIKESLLIEKRVVNSLSLETEYLKRETAKIRNQKHQISFYLRQIDKHKSNVIRSIDKIVSL